MRSGLLFGSTGNQFCKCDIMRSHVSSVSLLMRAGLLQHPGISGFDTASEGAVQ